MTNYKIITFRQVQRERNFNINVSKRKEYSRPALPIDTVTMTQLYDIYGTFFGDLLFNLWKPLTYHQWFVFKL